MPLAVGEGLTVVGLAAQDDQSATSACVASGRWPSLDLRSESVISQYARASVLCPAWKPSLDVILLIRMGIAEPSPRGSMSLNCQDLLTQCCAQQ